jgi:hypothetical protein
MDSEQFDRFTRSLDSRLSRRSLSRLGLSGIAASALATLGLSAGADDADAKKKNKKKKNKKKNKNNDNDDAPAPLAPVANTTCNNLGTACGNTAICQCRVDKNSVQTCENVTIPPNGINFVPCQSNVNCGAGQVCDAAASVCVSTCAN